MLAFYIIYGFGRHLIKANVAVETAKQHSPGEVWANNCQNIDLVFRFAGFVFLVFLVLLSVSVVSVFI